MQVINLPLTTQCCTLADWSLSPRSSNRHIRQLYHFAIPLITPSEIVYSIRRTSCRTASGVEAPA